MKQIYNIVKIFNHNINSIVKLAMVFLTLFSFNGNVWSGNTWIGNVGVGQDKGKAKVEVYSDALMFGGTKNTSEWATTTTTKQAKWTSNVNTTKGHCIFTAEPSTGYSFSGWFTSSNCSGQATSTANPYSTNSEGNGGKTYTYTYYAKFSPYTYTVNFFKEVGSTADANKLGSATVTYDAKFNAGTGWIETPTKAGYTFVGWYKSDGTTLVKGSDDVKITSNLVLYAHWTANNYTITLSSDLATTHGTTGIAVTFDANTNLTLPITVPSREGWTFWGYYTGENGSGKQLIDRNGNVLANVSGYTDNNKKWKFAGPVTLYAYMTEKSNQTITWGLTEDVEYATGELMGATATSGLAITYTSDRPEWGYINGNGRLVVVEPNKSVTITATQTGNDYWNPAEPVSKTFITLGAHPDQFTDVHASGITYGDLLGASTLTGNVLFRDVVIPGTLEWVDPSLMPDAGTADQMVLFTPDNHSAYSSVYFVVPVTVAKANPIIRWHISNVLHEQVRYSNFVESSNKEVGADFSYQTSDSELLKITDGVLITGEVSSKQSGWIKVSQPETENYNAYNATWNLKHDATVYPKASICLPFDPMTESEFNNARIAITKPGGWCNTNENGYREDYIANIDVTYTQRQGIALGSWEEGLSGLGDAIAHYLNPLNWNTPYEFAYSAKSVDLFFSGIPDKISFDVESQTVTTSPPDVTWPATAKNWHLFVSVDNESYTEVAHRTDDGSISYTFTDENVRYVRITYNGNFTGFVKNLRITRKQYLRTDKESLTFGTDAYPLQEPQELTISYSSLGVCGGSEDNAITITCDNPAFYVDEEIITENVDIEESDSYTIRVRCNDVNQTGTLTFRSNDGITATVALRSANPSITTTANTVFQTGTEHAPTSETVYHACRTHDFAACFDGAQAIFDTLYVYGVTESGAENRMWAYDAHKRYNVPAVDVVEGNIHTPCFVFKKNGTQYDYVRTFDAATKTLNIEASDKKLGFVGYKPATLATTLAASQIRGSNVDLYLDNTEMIASGNVFVLSGTSTIHANNTNILHAFGGAAVKLNEASSQLTVKDSWKSDALSSVLALRPAAEYPSVDLGAADGRMIVNGSQLELHNATNMAIAHMDGTTEMYDGEVHINDGAIGGEAVLGMPKHTYIDGGTFNDGTIEAYTVRGVGKRPRNSRGEMLSRHSMSLDVLAEKYSWYGQAHLIVDDIAKVNPMLMDEVVCIFEGYKNEDGEDADNWTKWPSEDDDVLIDAPMRIAGAEMKVKSLTINWVSGEKGKPAVTIDPDGGLTVGEGGIDGAVKDNILLKAGQEGKTKGETGFLRIHPNSAEPMPEATVELFSGAYYDMTATNRNDVGTWQFVGSPLANNVAAKSIFTESFIYEWDTLKGDWVNNRKKGTLKPFMGYSTSQYMNPDGLKVTYSGELVSNVKPQAIKLYYKEGEEVCHNMVANSYTAPIDITNFDLDDFDNVEGAIYLFNTGSRNDIANLENEAKRGETFSAPGQYIHIPIVKVKEMKTAFSDNMPTSIAPLQGFCVHATGANPKITLDYSKLVWNGNYKDNGNGPLRVIARDENKPESVRSLCVTLLGGGLVDNLYMLESEENDPSYENGSDARKMMSGALNIFSVAGADQLAVDATNSFIGTHLGIRSGEETSYTMIFSHLRSDNKLALLDNETKERIDINEGTEYTFYAEPNSEILTRFQIVGRANTPAVTTDIENVANGEIVHKFIKDNQLYILKNGVIYNAQGKVVH